MMYPTLNAEIGRKGYSIIELAKKLEMSNSTLGNKIKGRQQFTLKEGKKMREILGVNMTLDELFEE